MPRTGDDPLRSRAISGIVIAAGIASAAYRIRALSASGAIAASIVGATIHTAMAYKGSSAMVAYFATSSALGRLPRSGSPIQQRGNRRDAVQVLANGGPAAAFALLHALWTPSTIVTAAGYYGTLSAAAADTWATEIGTRWGGRPRNIANVRKTVAGESGGVTLAGIAASFLASLMMAVIAQLGEKNRRDWVLICVTGGMVGSLTDSLLGALLQERRWCACCNALTEQRIHTCGQPSIHVDGLAAINNDVVNLVAVIAGGLTASAMPALMAKLTERNGSRVEYVTTLTSSRKPILIGAP